MRARSFTPGAVLFVLLAGCAGLRLPAPPPVEADDWPMAARGIGRTGMTPERITPPLVEAWSADLPGATGSSALTLADSFLFVSTLRGDLVVLHTRTGRTIGRVSLGPALPGAASITQGRAFVAAAHATESLLCFDLESGRPLWRYPLGDIDGSPLLVGDRIFAGNTEGTFACVSGGGDAVWTFSMPRGASPKGIRGAPAADSARVFFTGDDGAMYGLRAGDGTLLWRVPAGAAIAAGPVAVDTLVVAATTAGIVTGVGREGGRIQWTYDAGAPVYAPVAAADSVIIAGTSGGLIHALRAADGSVIWSAPAGEAVSAAPVICNGTVYAVTLGREILALSLTRGEVLWRISVTGRIKTQPAAGRGMLFIATDDRRVIAFREASAP